MDILKKIEMLQEKITSNKEAPIPEPIMEGHYPGGYENMTDNLLCSYYELASGEYYRSYDELEKIICELKKRRISEEGC